MGLRGRLKIADGPRLLRGMARGGPRRPRARAGARLSVGGEAAGARDNTGGAVYLVAKPQGPRAVAADLGHGLAFAADVEDAAGRGEVEVGRLGWLVVAVHWRIVLEGGQGTRGGWRKACSALLSWIWPRSPRQNKQRPAKGALGLLWRPARTSPADWRALSSDWAWEGSQES